MHYKNCLLFLFLLFLFARIEAQSPGKQLVIKGRVADSITAVSMIRATVLLGGKDRSELRTYTDSLGYFSIQKQVSVLLSSYIRITMVGYQPFQAMVTLVNNQDTTIDLGVVYLVPASVNLKTIVINAPRPLIEQRVDGIIYNAENLPAPAGSNAADILRNIPLVQVDPNGNLAIRGSANIKVYIDGKPSELYGSSVADALKSIPGANIARVEVITQPSARYDAESTDAVVNILLKKQKENGVNANVSVLTGNRSANIAGDIKARHNKWTLQADVFYQKYRNRNGTTLKRASGQHHLSQTSESKQRGDYFFGGVTVSYSPDSLRTFTAGYRPRFSSYVTTSTAFTFNENDHLYEPSFVRDIYTPVSFRGKTFSAAYTGFFDNRQKELSVSAMFFNSRPYNGYNISQYERDSELPYLENFNSTGNNNDFMAEANYTQQFNKNWKLETGLKAAGKYLSSDNVFETYNNGVTRFIKDSTRSNIFTYSSNIYAAYANVAVTLQNWGASAGLRYEGTALNGSFKDTRLNMDPFSNLVPQLLISRMLANKSSFKIGYTTRLVRPYISYLNPTPINNDSITIQAGNPDLRPEIINRYQLSYLKNGNKLFSDIALFFNDNHNSIENIREPLQDGLFKSTWKNIGKNQRLGLSSSFTWKPSASFNIGATFTGQYVWLNSSAMKISNRGMMQELVIRSTFTFLKGYSIYFYGFFGGRNISLQGYRTGWKYYSMTLSKKWNERFEINLRADAFLTRHTWIREEIATDTYSQTLLSRYQNQNFRLTFSWKIGKREIKRVQARQIENED